MKKGNLGAGTKSTRGANVFCGFAFGAQLKKIHTFAFYFKAHPNREQKLGYKTHPQQLSFFNFVGIADTKKIRFLGALRNHRPLFQGTFVVLAATNFSVKWIKSSSISYQPWCRLIQTLKEEDHRKEIGVSCVCQRFQACAEGVAEDCILAHFLQGRVLLTKNRRRCSIAAFLDLATTLMT